VCVGGGVAGGDGAPRGGGGEGGRADHLWEQHSLIHTFTHGPNNYTDTKPLMSSLLVVRRVYRLEIQSVMLLFSGPLVN
jgi:hypothetical protein